VDCCGWRGIGGYCVVSAVGAGVVPVRIVLYSAVAGLPVRFVPCCIIYCCAPRNGPDSDSKCQERPKNRFASSFTMMTLVHFCRSPLKHRNSRQCARHYRPLLLHHNRADSRSSVCNPDPGMPHADPMDVANLAAETPQRVKTSL